jgi:hypothetical protein
MNNGQALTITVLFFSAIMNTGNAQHPSWGKESSSKLEKELVKQFGENERPRLQKGVEQVLSFWREEDGDAAEFESFVRKYFAPSSAPVGKEPPLDILLPRFEEMLEKISGHMNEITVALRLQSDLDLGPIHPVDELFAAYSPSAHLSDDFFKNKLAFVALLNFPLTTLEQRLAEGDRWTRRQWAETRLAHRFASRIPADVNAAISQAASEADQYIAEYNIWMHHIVDKSGTRLFPAKKRLLSHWNLRDEIKASYADVKTGLAKQRTIQQVMERIVTQTIPQSVIDNPRVDWNPHTNEVKKSAVKDFADIAKPDARAVNTPEPDTRYAMLLKTFRASRLADPYSPTAPTLIARRFNEDRELPEERVRNMLVRVLSSPLVGDVATLIEKRLGRPLEPFDIWYNGFRASGKYSEKELDDIVRKRYPTPNAFKQDMPNLLEKLGFAPERARYLSDHILVEPARGSGHAWGAQMREAKARLRTRVESEGMNYKGFNIAVHELGHNVEQVISLNDIDHTLLQGVPNTAFTEALAFVFQGHDLELLGLAASDPRNEALKTLNEFWGTYEIAGVALVDMQVWHWMYDHPDATPAHLKEATIQISKDVWNMYYAPVFKQRDVVLLGIYSHMVHSFLYLPDYPIGHMIAFQIEEQMKKAGSIGSEFERIARFGNISPDIWMTKATGAPVGPDALLSATERAIKELGQ